MNSVSWNPPTPPPHEHPSLECSGAPPLLTWGLSRLQFPCLPPGVHCCNDKSAKMYSTQRQPYNYKFSRNLRRGPCQGKLPCTKFSGRPHDDGLATCVPSIMYRRTTRHRVVSVPFDGSAVVEGTVCPTTASSPDAVFRGILATGLEKQKLKSKKAKQK